MRKLGILILTMLTWTLMISVSAIACGRADEDIISEDMSPYGVGVPVEVVLEATPRVAIQGLSEDELRLFIQQEQTNKVNAHNMAQAARELGLPEDHPVIQLAKDKWEITDSIEKEYLMQLDEIVWGLRKAEYPAATEVWLYLKELGYNDYVCAGIMGNLMAETGGQTLNLEWDLIT